MGTLMIKFGASTLFKSLVGLKNFLYDHSILSQKEITTPVISVGNLTMGGTGKTAVVDYLINYYSNKNVKVGVISRGYKGLYKNLIEVDLNLDQSLFGDEAYMLKMKHPQCPIFLSSQRIKAYEELVFKYNPDIIIADDAFQHRKLGRSFDLVILDCLEDLNNFKLIPQGRLREPLDSINRADLVLFNKINLLEPSERDKVLSFFNEKIITKFKPKYDYYYGEYHVSQIKNKNSLIDISDFDFTNSLLISGIGQPEGFKNMLKFDGASNFETLSFKDHHDYNNDDIDDILKKLEKMGSNKIVTTEKDYVKLKKFKKISDYLYVTQLKFETQNKDEFNEIFSGLSS